MKTWTSYKKTFFSVLFTLLMVKSFAQSSEIRAKVVDAETGEAIAYASAALLNQNTQAYVLGAMSDEEGQMIFENVASGTYTLRVTFVGYTNYTQENIKMDGSLKNLGVLKMEGDKNMLQEVTVEGRVPEMQLGIDRKVFDVSQSMVSVGGTATDLLSNVPTLQVDADGNVSLRGSTSVKILIDGKESAMAGSDITSFLQSLPANIIDKVELITNPSARYDAEGQSGIINIVLKKDVQSGLNGVVNTTVGSYGNIMAGANFNVRDNRFNYNFGYNFNRRHGKGKFFNDNQRLVNGVFDENSPRTISKSNNDRVMYGHTVRLGIDYYVTDNTTVSLGSNLSFRDNDRNSKIDYQYFNVPNYGSGSFRNSAQEEKDFGADFTFDIVQKLKREGEEIVANVSYGTDKEDGTNDYLQNYVGGRADLVRDNVTTERGKNWNFQLDYVLPLGEDHKFEAGYRSTMRRSDDTQFSSLLDTLTQKMEPDYNLSNDFTMKNDVHAVYVNYQKKLTERLGAQIGLRGEQALLNTKYYSKDPDISEDKRVTPGKLDYFRVYPSAFLTYEIGDMGDKLQLNYSRRVQRPRGWQVNPFLNISDETNFRQGNPNLLPEDIHSLELGFAKFYDRWNFITSAYYRRINKMTSPFMHSPSMLEGVVSDTINITYSRWENVADRDVFGLELISRVDIQPWWDVTLNANLNYNNTHPYEEFQVASVENVSWNTNVSSNVKFLKTFSLQVRGDYRAPMNSLQGRMRAMYSMDLALKKEVLNGKGSVVFNARDLLDTRKFRMDNYLPQSNIYMEHRWMPRMFSLSFSYRIGSQDMFRKNENSNPGNDDMGGEMQF